MILAFCEPKPKAKSNKLNKRAYDLADRLEVHPQSRNEYWTYVLVFGEKKASKGLATGDSSELATTRS